MAQVQKVDHRELEPILASGKFRLNSERRTKDLHLTQNDGCQAAAPPVPTPPAVQDTPSTRMGPHALAERRTVCGTSGRDSTSPLVAVGPRTDADKTFCAISPVVGRYAL